MLLLEEVQKLNKENEEKSAQQLTTGFLDLEAGVPLKDQQPDVPACNLVDYLREDSQRVVREKDEVVGAVSEEKVDEKTQEVEAVVTEKKHKLDVKPVVKEKVEETAPVPEEKKEEVVSPDGEKAKASAAPEKEKEPTTTR